MPFIDVKLSKKISQEEKERLKSDLGKSISVMHKPESYLMVGIADGYDLYFAGNKLANGAFVSVSVFGKVNPADTQKMTECICSILNERFSVAENNVYVTYSGVENWGWNGGNF
ncbi:MAG: hypothetical protein K2H43_04965 [Clostridia bacterium]|nr:hypothetical protein [Clostridia bacterium]